MGRIRGEILFTAYARISNPSAMMDAHTKDEVLMFMMYRKEIGFLIADERTRRTRKLTSSSP